MTRLTGRIVSYSHSHQNGKVRIDGTKIDVVFHTDEFKSKIYSKVGVGQSMSFSVRKIVRPDVERPFSVKAVNCVIEFEDDDFLSVEEISGLFPASPEAK